MNLRARWQAIPRKKRRRIIRLSILALLLVIAAVVLLKVLGGKNGDEGEVVTDVVQYGSITSTVQGSGLVKAKSSETITITTVGTVTDVLVAEETRSPPARRCSPSTLRRQRPPCRKPGAMWRDMKSNSPRPRRTLRA